jgi:sugar/nucleoside kinase (ribokinase family)
MNALVLVTQPKALSTDSLERAIALVRATCERCLILGDIRRHEVDTRGLAVENRIPPDDHESLIQWIESQLDLIELSIPTLIVCIGPTVTVARYTAERMSGQQVSESAWEVISSNFARFAYLGTHRSLGSLIPRDTAKWLKGLKEEFGSKQILSSLRSVRGLQIGLLGESIIDEYLMCEALGKVSKDPLIAFSVRSSEEQLGGVLAVARHMSGLGAHPVVFSEISRGDAETLEAEYQANFDLTRCRILEERPLVKTRFVDRTSNSRVFETYRFGGQISNRVSDLTIESHLKEWANPLIVVDYGHGLITDAMRHIINDRSALTAVNAQSNAGNRGFNPISKYSGAQMTFLNGSEVEVETRRRAIDLQSLVSDLGSELKTEEFYVTNGASGLIVWTKSSVHLQIPGMAPTVIDRTGAGDALLATVAVMRFAGVPVKIAAFFGNIAGALMCGVLGNSLSISATLLEREARQILDEVTRGSRYS